MVVANHEKILGTDEKAQNKTKQKNDNNVLIVRTKRQIFNFVTFNVIKVIPFEFNYPFV